MDDINKRKFIFWVENLARTERHEWRGLTLRQAQTMYERTERSQPTTLSAFGWEEQNERDLHTN